MTVAVREPPVAGEVEHKQQQQQQSATQADGSSSQPPARGAAASEQQSRNDAAAPSISTEPHPVSPTKHKHHRHKHKQQQHPAKAAAKQRLLQKRYLVPAVVALVAVVVGLAGHRASQVGVFVMSLQGWWCSRRRVWRSCTRTTLLLVLH
jgi:Flp pilus assembly protein TadB